MKANLPLDQCIRYWACSLALWQRCAEYERRQTPVDDEEVGAERVPLDDGKVDDLAEIERGRSCFVMLLCSSVIGRSILNCWHRLASGKKSCVGDWDGIYSAFPPVPSSITVALADKDGPILLCCIMFVDAQSPSRYDSEVLLHSISCVVAVV